MPPRPPQTRQPRAASPTRVVEIAVNLDDVSPQVIGDLRQRLLDEGALDVWTIAIGMKKQRPGVMLCVLATLGDRDRLARMMLEHTGAMGVRWREWDRLVLERRHETIMTRLGPVRLKIGTLPRPRSGSSSGALPGVAVQPEFEDVKARAIEAGVTVRTMLRIAEAAADAWLAERQMRKGPGHSR